MNGERLKLVTDFASLRVGMIVVVKPCRKCFETHRHMLVRLDRSCRHFGAGGFETVAPAWDVIPGRRCSRPPHAEPIVSVQMVAAGIVFRVVDGLDPEADKRADTISSTAARLGVALRKVGLLAVLL